MGSLKDFRIRLETETAKIKGESVKKSASQLCESRLTKKQQIKAHLAQMDKDGVVYCPKCYSTSLSTNKKGFGVGKAVVGAVVAGPIGLVAGNINAKKVRVTCLKCGHNWLAGK